MDLSFKGEARPELSLVRLLDRQVAVTPFAAYGLKLYSSRDCVVSVSPPRSQKKIFQDLYQVVYED